MILAGTQHRDLICLCFLQVFTETQCHYVVIQAIPVLSFDPWRNADMHRGQVKSFMIYSLSQQ